MNRPVPRYTSYPTVPFWKDKIDIRCWEQLFGKGLWISHTTWASGGSATGRRILIRRYRRPSAALAFSVSAMSSLSAGMANLVESRSQAGAKQTRSVWVVSKEKFFKCIYRTGSPPILEIDKLAFSCVRDLRQASGFAYIHFSCTRTE